jgi:hypothetical protein
MESLVHLRKGRTPRRLHADLDGLKDDELGRGGRPLEVLSSELKPGDAGTLRQAVGVCTDWLHRHGFSLEQS